MAAVGSHRPATRQTGGGGMVGATWGALSWLRLELAVGLDFYAAPLAASTPIRIGARLEWPANWQVKPFLSLALAHVHEMPWSTVQQHTVAALLGLSEHGVGHRTGAETGLGVAFNIPKSGAAPFAGRLTARVNGVWLAGSGNPVTMNLEVGAGACF